MREFTVCCLLEMGLKGLLVGSGRGQGWRELYEQDVEMRTQAVKLCIFVWLLENSSEEQVEAEYNSWHV